MNARKKQVLDAAYSLFIEKGYAATSIQDILEKAKISKGTFYNYFTSKAECLRAIIASVAEEIKQERRKTAAGKQPDDRGVLVEQMVIRMKIQKEQNVFLLYESVFYSQDEDLKAFAKKQHLAELQWLSGRITDLFGEKAKPYALENAAMILGSLQHLTHIWMNATEEEMPVQAFIEFILRRTEASLTDQIAAKDTVLKGLSLQMDMQETNREQTVSKLKTAADAAAEKEAELIGFIADELAAPYPRVRLIETVLCALEEEQALSSTLTDEVRLLTAD